MLQHLKANIRQTFNEYVRQWAQSHGQRLNHISFGIELQCLIVKIKDGFLWYVGMLFFFFFHILKSITFNEYRFPLRDRYKYQDVVIDIRAHVYRSPKKKKSTDSVKSSTYVTILHSWLL